MQALVELGFGVLKSRLAVAARVLGLEVVGSWGLRV